MRSLDTTAASWQPLAYVTVADERCRAQVGEVLQRHGWLVIEHPSAFHLLADLADVIEQRSGAPRPCLIVVDEVARGVAGTTLARGLRELGLITPVVLIGGPRGTSPLGPAVYAVDREEAATAIAALVGPWSPPAVLRRPEASRPLRASA